MAPSLQGTQPSGSPFRHRAFAVIWTATLVSNIGWWMYSAACGWLMVRLSPAPLVVALVQVANTLPGFLFAIPAGALTDIVDKRKFLIVGEVAIAVVATLFAVLVWLHLVTPLTLLVFAFAVAAGDALASPAYQAIVPMLVPKNDVPKAVVANSAGINVSRAVGPALGGVFLGAFGAAAPFWINAVSNFGSIGALLWWREPEQGGARLPPEHLSAMEQVGRERRRDGAYDWRLFEDPAQPRCFVETFLSDSWLDYLRQHERVTKSDRVQEEAARKFQVGEGPVTTHLIAVHLRRGRMTG